MTFTKIFLRAKHWQLFLLTFGILILFQFFMMATLFASIGEDNVPDMSIFFKVLPILMIASGGTLFGWYWSVAMGLQNKIPSNIKMKTGKFKVFFFIPITYIILITIVAASSMNGFVPMSGRQNPGFIMSSMALIIPMHLFCMFCIFYCLYFVAKTFKTVELQRETTFSDFAGEFFMIWFYPVGIWIVQPKINKMIVQGRAI